MIAVMVVAGFIVGRALQSTRVAIGAGGVTSLLNLLVLGGVLSSGDESPGNWLGLWCLGFVATGLALGGLGGWWAMRKRHSSPTRLLDLDWLFAATACSATFLLVIIGGVVTSEEAGLAVPDWPTSFESNMFLYPLSKMISQSDVYYEHTHRLFGSLVGLTVLALTGDSWLAGQRRWLAKVISLALLLVLFQGLLGGMRVEQADLNAGTVPEWKERAKETFDALGLTADRLRVFHGVLGQVFLGFLVAIAAFSSRTWRDAVNSAGHRLSAGDRSLSIAFITCILIQLLLGAVTRHVSRDPFVLIHLVFAFVVAGAGLMVAVRRLSVPGQIASLRRNSGAIATLIIVQLTLGFSAFVLTAGDESTLSTLVATAHQALGALILSLAVLDLVWVSRLIAVGPTVVDDPGPARVEAT